MRLEDEVSNSIEAFLLLEESFFEKLDIVKANNTHLIRKSYSVLGRLSARQADITKDLEEVKKRVDKVERKN